MFSRAQRAGDGNHSLRRRGAASAAEADAGEQDAGPEEIEEDEVAAGATGSGAEAGEADEWDEQLVDPLMVRFTQDKVHPFFYRRGPIVNVLPKIRPVLRSVDDDDEEIVELVPPFGQIHCLRRGEDVWSLDNRRLYALQMAAMEQWPQRCRVRILCRDRLPRHKFKSQYRKFNTTSEGRVVAITARYQQFDTWSWFDRAVEIEVYHFSQRLGVVLSCFEILPVIGALLFRTGLTGFVTRTPFVVGFVASFALDVLRQRVPVIETSLCEYQVLAVMNGEVLPVGRCCGQLLQTLRRLRGGDEEDETTAAPMSTPQVAVTSAVAAVLLLPYLIAIPSDRLRSSLMSCWLGIGCVLLVQLVSAVRLLRSADTARALGALSGAADGPATSGLSRRRSSGASTEPADDDGSPDWPPAASEVKAAADEPEGAPEADAPAG